MLKRIIDGLIRRFDWYVRIPLAHKKFDRINILNSMDSIQYIIDHKCSVSRYGDGEIVMLLGGVSWLSGCRWKSSKTSQARSFGKRCSKSHNRFTIAFKDHKRIALVIKGILGLFHYAQRKKNHTFYFSRASIYWYTIIKILYHLWW